MNSAPGYQELYFTTDDGRRLHFRDYSGPLSRTPVICIPGLQSNLRTYDLIAPHMAKSRRVLCVNPRGRGLSDYDSDPENYRLRREALDILQLTRATGVRRCVVFGASRGGLSGLLLAANTKIAAGLVLIDIGPQTELAAMGRIIKDIAPGVSFESWRAAAESIKSRHGSWFPNLPDEKWLFWAEMIYKEENGRVIPDSDPSMVTRVDEANAGRSESASLVLWQVFERLPRMPILVVRGENSDVLSEATVARMKAMRPAMVAVTVKDRGHRPFLDEPESIAAIDAFLQRIP